MNPIGIMVEECISQILELIDNPTEDPIYLVESEGYFCDTEEEYDDQFDAIDRDTQLFDHLYNEIVTELKREKSLNYHRGYDQHKHIHDSYGSVIACFDRSALFKVKDADERPWLIVGYQHEDKELPIVLSAQLLDEDAG